MADEHQPTVELVTNSDYLWKSWKALRQLDGKPNLTLQEYERRSSQLFQEGLHDKLPDPLYTVMLFESFPIEKTTKEHFAQRLLGWVKSRSFQCFYVTEESAHKGENDDWLAEWLAAYGQSEAEAVIPGWRTGQEPKPSNKVVLSPWVHGFLSKDDLRGILGEIGIGNVLGIKPPQLLRASDGALIVAIHGTLKSPRFLEKEENQGRTHYYMRLPLGVVISFKVYDNGPQRIDVQARCTSLCLADYFREAIQWIGETWDVDAIRIRFAATPNALPTTKSPGGQNRAAPQGRDTDSLYDTAYEELKKDPMFHQVADLSELPSFDAAFGTWLEQTKKQRSIYKKDEPYEKKKFTQAMTRRNKRN